MAIGSLAVRVSADTAKFTSGMNKTRKPAQNLKQQMKDVSRVAAKMSGAMAAAGAAIVAAGVRQSSQAITEQTRLARSLNATNREVAGLTSAFKAYGLQQEDVADAINTITDRANDAASGMQSMADDFGLVGMEVDELRGKAPTELFRQFAEAIKDTDDPSKRTAAAVRILGDDIGRKLLPLLMEGGSAIDRFTQQAEQMGLAVSAVEADQVEKANVAMSRIQDAIAGVSRSLTVELSPIIQGVADQFTGAAAEAGGLRKEVQDAVSDSITALSYVIDTIEGISRAFTLAGQAIATRSLSIQKNMLSVAEFIYSGPVDAINELREVANMIPGIDFGKVEQPEFVEGLRSRLKTARGAVEEGKKAMHQTLMEPMPGAAMREWAADVQAQSQKASESVIEDRENERRRSVAIRQIMSRQFANINIKEMEQETAINQQKLARLRDFLGKRAETEIADHERKMERLREMLNLELITQQEFQERERQAKKEHEKALTDMAIRERKRETDAVGRFAQANQAIRENSVASEAAALRSGLQTMFGDQKAASLAIGALKRFEAVTSAYAWGSSIGGPPMGAAAAATAAVAQASTLSDMGSTSMGGGGSTGGSTQPAAGSTSAPAQGGSSGGGGASSPTTMINLQGDSFGRDQVRDLLERISEEKRDGGRILIN